MLRLSPNKTNKKKDTVLFVDTVLCSIVGPQTRYRTQSDFLILYWNGFVTFTDSDKFALRASVRCCINLGNSATKIFKMLRQFFGDLYLSQKLSIFYPIEAIFYVGYGIL